MTIWKESRFVRCVSPLRFETVILRYAINAIIATALAAAAVSDWPVSQVLMLCGALDWCSSCLFISWLMVRAPREPRFAWRYWAEGQAKGKPVRPGWLCQQCSKTSKAGQQIRDFWYVYIQVWCIYSHWYCCVLLFVAVSNYDSDLFFTVNFVKHFVTMFKKMLYKVYYSLFLLYFISADNYMEMT